MPRQSDIRVWRDVVEGTPNDKVVDYAKDYCRRRFTARLMTYQCNGVFGYHANKVRCESQLNGMIEDRFSGGLMDKHGGVRHVVKEAAARNLMLVHQAMTRASGTEADNLYPHLPPLPPRPTHLQVLQYALDVRHYEATTAHAPSNAAEPAGRSRKSRLPAVLPKRCSTVSGATAQPHQQPTLSSAAATANHLCPTPSPPPQPQPQPPPRAQHLPLLPAVPPSGSPAGAAPRRGASFGAAPALPSVSLPVV